MKEGILITRPKHQANSLAEAIKALGHIPIVFPTIEIQALNLSLEDYSSALTQADKLFFISQNAVLNSMPAINIDSIKGTFFAVGESTAHCLNRFGVKQVTYPRSAFTSDALLDLAILENVKGQYCVILCGENPRQHLGSELRKRGAKVDELVVYRRVIPNVSVEKILQQWQKGLISWVVVTSEEGLKNLAKMLGDAGSVLFPNVKLIIIRQTMQQVALKLGFTSSNIVVADNATDEAIVKTLKEHIA